MRAMVCHHLSRDRSGLIFERDWAEAPPPGAGEVTVAMACAALNYPDVLMLSGGYQFAPPLPFVPGVEGSGTIIAVGEGVDPSAIGRAVIVGARFGCLAERLTLPLAATRVIPPGMSHAAAAAFTVAALTAYVGLVRRGRLAPGERVAVAGAGGGTGLAAIGVAKALGASVVALASDHAKLTAARDAGADECILVERSAEVPALPPVDVVFDPVGGRLTVPLLASLRRGGRYLIIGFVGGIAEVAFDRLGEIEVIGVRAGEYARRDPARGAANLVAIDALAAAGLAPRIGLRVQLAEAAAAFAAMADGTLVGKAVIDCA
ncbi:zinc-binding dehydrogenase [Glacieibacterium megasporae]|uniref:zinc-binding dehydrogenase n=1 Tax=Glacieibacterium megasporae TaxID=2835787 RepID=UPI001C1DFB0F|nr:zinc-binding dehydrogenase [Polymorphobacter megasporae]UAJ09374.1 zinc-binding dehydrogenase [Polymorphobacter megasporae]